MKPKRKSSVKTHIGGIRKCSSEMCGVTLVEAAASEGVIVVVVVTLCGNQLPPMKGSCNSSL